MIRRIYLFGKRIIKSKDWKRIKTVFSLSLFLAVFLFSIQNTLVRAATQSDPTECGAVTGACFDVQKSYEKSTDMAAKDVGINTSDPHSVNTHFLSGILLAWNNIVGGANTKAMELVPEGQHARLVNELDYFSRVGVYGLATDSMYLALESSPSINVSRHIAQEWIPGDAETMSVYAADSGYDVLMNSGISIIWEKTRNIAYLLFVLVLIVAGFMIMFRQKIGGQTAVTVMNTIPNVLISLILVTFSFAIVGLMMNFGGILINVMIGALDLDPNDIIYADGVFSILGHFFKGGVVGGGGWTSFGVGGTGAGLAVLGSAGEEAIGSALGGLGASAAGIGAATPIIAGIFLVVGSLSALIVIAIIGIVAWASIKVFFTLLKAYLGLLIDTVLAPILLAVSAIPGQEKMRADWFRRVMKNIMIFPTVFFLVNVATFIFNNGLQLAFPGLLTGGTDYSGVGTGSFAQFVITRAVIIYLYFLAAQAPKILDDFFPQSGGKGLGDALKGAASGVPLIGGMFG